MTSAFLQSELTSLIADSKKKAADVRSAAEKSLADLKSITVTSENQLAAGLSRIPHFVDPFVLACKSRNVKLANSATACLQRLVASRAVPNDRLEDVLNGFREVMNVSYDVQLKILQTLPALLQLYASEVRGQLLARTLEICVNLEGSKTNLVSSSARATFEQLVDSVFERARVEAQNSKTHERQASTASLSTAADDASRIFEDLCSILNRTEATFLQVEISSMVFLLDTLEKVIDGNAPYIRGKSHLIEACRTQLLPGLTTLLNGRDDFHATAQCLRICYVILLKLPQLLSDMSELLETLLKFLDRDGGPFWKRILALEFFRQLCSNFGLMMRSFDSSQPDANNFIIKLMSTIVRIAAEDPTLIGLGRQSTVPVNGGREDDMASIEAQGIGGGGLASVSSADASVTGISLDFSTIEKRLLDDEDSASVPTFPKTYLYALILECISSFCEGLSKFIMPLSVSNKYLERSETVNDDDGEDSTADQTAQAKTHRRRTPGHKYQRLANPLKMTTSPQLPQIQACSTMVDRCWPAILATCSTFLNAALDSHFYHLLIRSMQKLAQVSGTLELGTPRDALLTSLAKGSVPPNANAIIALSQAVSEAENDGSGRLNGMKSPATETPRQTLNVRHLLCLRALLNLGIALGPTMTQESWFIVIETLQQVETLMSLAGTSRKPSSQIASQGEVGSQERPASLAGEMSAVNAATKRMFESTRSYTDDSFAAITQALLRMIGDIQTNRDMPSKGDIVKSPATLASPVVHKRGHNASRSVSGLWSKTKALDVELAFVLSKTKDLARVNLHRFASMSSAACTWDLIVPQLLSVANSSDVNRDVRLQSASLVDLIAIETMKLLDPDVVEEDEIDLIQCKCVEVLAEQVRWGSSLSEQDNSLNEELRKRVFEALENVLGHSGDSFHNAWRIVFRILEAGVTSGYIESVSFGEENVSELDLTSITPVAFRCVQLICNDFLQLLDAESLEQLIKLLFSFGAQLHDLNMSLATTGLLRNITSLLENRTENIDFLQEGFSHLSLATSSNERKTSSYLWALTITQLRQLCADRRGDVRDASIRLLLQALESACEKITPRSFALALDAHLCSLMRSYQELIVQSDTFESTYTSSLAKLIEGTTTLMNQNMEHLISDSNFHKTWERLLGVWKDVLAESTTTIQTLIFESLAKLLAGLKEVSEDPSSFVTAALSLWSQYTPAETTREVAVSNQDVLAAHVNLFVQASTKKEEGKINYTLASSDSEPVEHAMRSIRRALLTARHPSYTNDVRKRTTEQDAAFEALVILRQMMDSTRDRYFTFLLELIRDMFSPTVPANAVPIQTAAASKKIQRPTYIAIITSCLDLLRQTAEDCDGTTVGWTLETVDPAFSLLHSLIESKYTSVTINQDSPLWQNATITAVSVVEATRNLFLSSQEASKKDKNVDIVSGITSCLDSILGSGGLESHQPPPSPDIIIKDETFDITHFKRFHSTALSFLSQASTRDGTLQYIQVLFQASLVAKPWFFDFPFTTPEDITTNPLKDITKLRKGSVHPPKFPPRGRIPYAALDALFNIVDPNSSGYQQEISNNAAPYLLLRIAHPMKVFLVDQPLRGLTPLPIPLQEELRWILERCLTTRISDEAFRTAMATMTGLDNVEGKSYGVSTAEDGKTHLRILFNLVLKMQRGWRNSMRLPDGKGWQDDVVGLEIERAMEMWVESVGGGWGFVDV